MYHTTIIIFIALTVGVIGHCPDDEETPSPPPKILFYKNESVLAPVECPVARDCKEWYEVGINKSGIYPIKPDDGPSFQVYCDMESEGGGWTVFQRRQDGSVDFYRNWVDYENGFGTLSGEHWLGLSKLHRVTPDTFNSSSRVDLKDFSDEKRYAQYNTFQISDSNSQYAITVSGYSGTAGDSLGVHSTMKFSTKDRDNDIDNGNCAVGYKGAWWYGACHASNLNGQYKPTSTTTYGNGLIWYAWKGNHYYSLKFTEMKVRRN